MDFIRLQLSYLEAADEDTRRCGLICLSHLVQGVFGEVINAEHQMEWVSGNVQLLRQCGAFEAVYTLLRSSCSWMECDEYVRLNAVLTGRNDGPDIRSQCALEIKCCTTILYFMLVIDCEEPFKRDIRMPILAVTNISLSRPPIYSMVHPNYILHEIERSI